MLIKLLLPLFILITNIGCQKYPVAGHIQMKSSNLHPMVYLIDPVNFGSLVASFEGKVIDSARIDDQGHFRFSALPISEPKMYILTIQKPGEKYTNKLENEDMDKANYIPFVYRNDGNVIINTSDLHFLKDVEIKGDIKENLEISSLIKSRYHLKEKYLSHPVAADEANLLDHEKAIYNFQYDLMKTVEKYSDVAVNALALRWISTNGDYERVPELVKHTCQKLNATDPKHLWTAQICAKSAALPLSPGDQFPDFLLPMMSGDTTSLYSLLGKKITLIDLWASWCAPCRHENQHTLVPLWDEYHDQGFQVIGYALDSSEKGWKNAIKKDGADRWAHASHLRGDESPLFEKLKITTIPANYLLDAKGTILAKNLHGDELVKWVSGYKDTVKE